MANRNVKIGKYLAAMSEWTTVSELSLKLSVSTDVVRKSLDFLAKHKSVEAKDGCLYRAILTETK